MAVEEQELMNYFWTLLRLSFDKNHKSRDSKRLVA
jgi:hypothetical protein